LRKGGYIILDVIKVSLGVGPLSKGSSTRADESDVSEMPKDVSVKFITGGENLVAWVAST